MQQQRKSASVSCRLEKHALNKEDFAFIMRNLPVPVADSEIDEMFEFADKNQDGKLSFAEFELMVIEKLSTNDQKIQLCCTKLDILDKLDICTLRVST